MILALLLDILLILAISLVGFLSSILLIERVRLLEVLSLSFPLGAGLLTWLLFVLSWLGIPITYWSLLLVLVVFVSVLSALVIRRGRWRAFNLSELQRDFLNFFRKEPWNVVVWCAILAMFGLSALIAVGRSYSQMDAVDFWAVKGYGIAFEGSIFAAEDWGAHGLNYPLNVSMMIGFFRLVSGDVLPGSKLIFPIFFAASMLGIYEFWRRFDVRSRFAAFGILFLSLIPVVFYHSTIGYANLALACYILLAFFYTMRGIVDGNLRLQSLGGILLGLAAWTRVEGIMYCLALVLAVLLSHMLTRKYRIHLIAWLLPTAIISGVWFIFMMRYGYQSNAVIVIKEWTTGGWALLNVPAISVILSYLRERIFRPKIWGIYFAVIGLLLLAGVRKLKPSRNPEAFTCLLTALALGVSTITIFYISSFRFGVEFVEGWLGRGFSRASIPATLMFGVAAIFLEGSGSSKENEKNILEHSKT